MKLPYYPCEPHVSRGARDHRAQMPQPSDGITETPLVPPPLPLLPRGRNYGSAPTVSGRVSGSSVNRVGSRGWNRIAGVAVWVAIKVETRRGCYITGSKKTKSKEENKSERSFGERKWEEEEREEKRDKRRRRRTRRLGGEERKEGSKRRRRRNPSRRREEGGDARCLSGWSDSAGREASDRWSGRRRRRRSGHGRGDGGGRVVVSFLPPSVSAWALGLLIFFGVAAVFFVEVWVGEGGGLVRPFEVAFEGIWEGDLPRKRGF